ncbi:hypothetical protein GmRootV213_56670 (plasmid) [Variovorax sp. V213]
MTPPLTFEDAVAKARTLMSLEDKDVLRTFPLEEASWRLHMTLGYQLRGELGLWHATATQALFDDMNAKMPHRLVIDGDTASGALIDALWHDARSRG